MTRLLIQIGKKILLPLNGEVLISYSASSDESLDDWVHHNFAVTATKMQEKHEWNVIFISAVHHGNCLAGSLISISSAITRISESDYVIKEYLREQQAATNVQLQYGIRNGKIICISEIAQEQRGLKCDCVCPGCGQALQARLGKRKQHHFSHTNQACNIKAAQQTALHILAKEIIEEEKRILVPGIVVKRSDTSFRDKVDSLVAYLPATLEYRSACYVGCTSVVLEKRISSIIPDIVITVAGKPCLIEIAVTHFVDEEKAKKAKDIGLPVFEIDISALNGQLVDKNHLRDVVLKQQDNRYWIFNPLHSDATAWAEIEFRRKYEKAQSEAIKHYEKEELEAKKKQEKQENTTRLLDDLFQPENYRTALNKLNNDDAVISAYKEFTFFPALGDAIPFFLDIPITGEMLFTCDRRIWQGAIFDRFIYNRRDNEEEKATLHIKKIQKWLTAYQKTFKIDWSLASKTYAHIGTTGRCFSLLYDVIKQYLSYLSEIGFLSDLSYQQAEVKQTHSLIPPNCQKAAQLQNALQVTDHAAPNIDDIISAIIHPKPHYRKDYEQSNIYEIESYEAERKEKKIAYEKARASEKDTGYQCVQSLDFFSDETIVDNFGYRWLCCTACSAIKREDEMSSYGGIGRTNLGICRECSRK